MLLQVFQRHENRMNGHGGKKTKKMKGKPCTGDIDRNIRSFVNELCTLAINWLFLEDEIWANRTCLRFDEPDDEEVDFLEKWTEIFESFRIRFNRKIVIEEDDEDDIYRDGNVCVNTYIKRKRGFKEWRHAEILSRIFVEARLDLQNLRGRGWFVKEFDSFYNDFMNSYDALMKKRGFCCGNMLQRTPVMRTCQCLQKTKHNVMNVSGGFENCAFNPVKVVCPVCCIDNELTGSRQTPKKEYLLEPAFECQQCYRTFHERCQGVDSEIPEFDCLCNNCRSAPFVCKFDAWRKSPQLGQLKEINQLLKEHNMKLYQVNCRSNQIVLTPAFLKPKQEYEQKMKEEKSKRHRLNGHKNGRMRKNGHCNGFHAEPPVDLPFVSRILVLVVVHPKTESNQVSCLIFENMFARCGFSNDSTDFLELYPFATDAESHSVIESIVTYLMSLQNYHKKIVFRAPRNASYQVKKLVESVKVRLQISKMNFQKFADSHFESLYDVPIFDEAQIELIIGVFLELNLKVPGYANIEKRKTTKFSVGDATAAFIAQLHEYLFESESQTFKNRERDIYSQFSMFQDAERFASMFEEAQLNLKNPTERSFASQKIYSWSLDVATRGWQPAQ
uniref:Uncharacterized protein n=1 Tax=Panagrolaimus sp. JU765 TaxID=591449 RepID=A0AC34QNG7_9BILA